MVAKCCIKKCKQERIRGCINSFHGFPVNPAARKKWIEVTKVTGNCKFKKICSLHFKNEDFVLAGNIMRLKDTAVPAYIIPPFKTDQDVNSGIPDEHGEPPEMIEEEEFHEEENGSDDDDIKSFDNFDECRNAITEEELANIPKSLPRCKCCLEAGEVKGLWTEYLVNREREVYGDMLNECFGFSWSKPVDLNDTAEVICVSCVERLRDAVTFKKEVLASAQLLGTQLCTGNNLEIKQEGPDTQVEYLNMEEEPIDEQAADTNVSVSETENSTAVSGTAEQDDHNNDEPLAKEPEDPTEAMHFEHTNSSTSIPIVSKHVPRPRRPRTGPNSLGRKHFFETSSDESSGYDGPPPATRIKHTTHPEDTEMGQLPDYVQVEEHPSRRVFKKRVKRTVKMVLKKPSSAIRAARNLHVSRDAVTTDKKNQVKVKREIDDIIESEARSDKKTTVPKKNTKYSEEDLLRAVEEVRSKNMSQATASKVYKVPRSTIFDMLNRKKYKKPKVEPKDEPEEEKKPIVKNKSEDPQEMMKHTNNIVNIMENSNATPIRCHGDGGYMCCFCDQQHHNPADLKLHTLNSHDDITKRTFTKGKRPSSYFVKLDITALKCKICNSDMDTLEKFIEHLIADHKKLMYSDIKNHILPFKFDTDELRCVVCGNVFNKFKVLQEHLNVHYKNYTCEICDAGFVARIILYNHSNGHKTGTFKCELCTKVYNTQRKLRSHQNAVHKFASMVSKCGYCNEKFKNYHRKVDHLTQVHGVTPMSFRCKACDKDFRSQAALRIHTKRDHLMERRFKCTQCDMKFFAKLALEGHMLKHTGVRQFQCDLCLKFYARKTTLREHMRIHENNRRFKCEQCGAAFVQKCSWRGHMRSKHGVIS